MQRTGTITPDRRRYEKTVSKGGQDMTLPAQLGQLNIGQDGKGLLRFRLLGPDNLPRLWDRKEKNIYSAKIINK